MRQIFHGRTKWGFLSPETSVARVSRPLFCAGGILLLLWAFGGDRFRDAEGFLRKECCLAVAAGLAAILVGLASLGPYRSFARWFALALTGQAVALQLIDAGPFIHYQHYRPLGQFLTATNLVLLVLILIQSGLVLRGARIYWPAVRAWGSRNLRAWQILSVCLAFFLTGAAVSREKPTYLVELGFAAFVQSINLINIVLAALRFPEQPLRRLKCRWETFLGQSGETFWSAKLPTAAALWTTVLAAVLCVISYERHPHIPDEVVYLYHARYLAAGRLTMPAPPVPEAFNIDLMTYEANRWYCPVPPGWPALLALGVLVGAPWLVNPVLAGVNVLLAYALIRDLYDRRIARLVVLLLCTSPWHIFMAMNFMTHTSTLTFALAAAVAVRRARETGKLGWSCLGGMAAGVVTLIRPLDGLVVAGLAGLWTLRRIEHPSRLALPAAFAFGCAVVACVVLPYNRHLTGNATVFPINAYIDKYYGPKRNAFGFGPERGLGWAIDPYPGHSPLEGLINSSLNAFSINTELFGWSSGSLLLAALLIFSGALRRSDYSMLALIATVFGFHFFYWFSGGPDFGARYWYLMLIPLVVLTVRGMQFLQNIVPHGGETRVLIAVLSLSTLALTNYIPWRAIDKYHHYLNMRPDVQELAKKHHFAHAIVLVRGNRHPDYASAAVYNPVDLSADGPLYVWDGSKDVRKNVIESYPERQVWVVDGPSITRCGYQVVAGPRQGHELLEEAGDRPVGRRGGKTAGPS